MRVMVVLRTRTHVCAFVIGLGDVCNAVCYNACPPRRRAEHSELTTDPRRGILQIQRREKTAADERKRAEEADMADAARKGNKQQARALEEAAAVESASLAASKALGGGGAKWASWAAGGAGVGMQPCLSMLVRNLHVSRGRELAWWQIAAGQCEEKGREKGSSGGDGGGGRGCSGDGGGTWAAHAGASVARDGERGGVQGGAGRCAGRAGAGPYVLQERVALQVA